VEKPLSTETLRSGTPLFDNRRILKLVLPLMAEQLLAAFIGVADTYMVTSCGESVVSGVAQVDLISTLIVTVFTALATGGTIVASQYLGRRDAAHANVAANQVFLTTAGISLVLMAVCLALRGTLLTAIFGQMEPAVLSAATDYFVMIAISYPFFALFSVCSAILRANGNSFTPMVASILMNLLNVAGNAVFIYGFQMAARGAGLASMLSRIVGFVVLFCLVRRPKYEVGLATLFPLRIDFPMIRSVLAIGIPTSVENLIFHAGRLIVQRFVTSYGTMHLAANAVASNVTNFVVILCSAYGLALTTIVGQCMGAGEKKQARDNILKMAGLCWASMLVLCAAMFLLRYPIAGLYHLEGPTQELTAQLLTVSSIGAAIFWTLSFIPAYGLRAAGDVKYIMWAGIISMWVCRVALAYLFGTVLGLGSVGILLGMTVDWACRGVLFTVRFFRGRWMEKKVV